MGTAHPEDALIGRGALLAEIRTLLRKGRSVLLVGPEHIGKTAIVQAVAAGGIAILDPFERVSARQGARVRAAMDRGAVFLAAARTLDRSRLGCVGRIAFRFHTVRVPPLPAASMRRLVAGRCAAASLPDSAATRDWVDGVIRVARGRPGVALAIVDEAARVWRRSARLPVPAAAYVDLSMDRASGPPRSGKAPPAGHRGWASR